MAGGGGGGVGGYQQEKYPQTQIWSRKKHMPQLEDNTFAIKSVCFMGIYGVHQVKSSVDFFLCHIEVND